jgi:serine/threonine protein kinase
VLGQGAFGRVLRAIDTITGAPVAIKVVKKGRHLRTQQIQHPVTRETVSWPLEALLLGSLSHPNIVRLIEVIEGSRHFYIVTEYHGHAWSGARGATDLFECIESSNGLPEEVCVKVMRQLVDALLYLKRHCIYHMDLKDENVTIDQDYNVKLIGKFDSHACWS